MVYSQDTLIATTAELQKSAEEIKMENLGSLLSHDFAEKYATAPSVDLKLTEKYEEYSETALGIRPSRSVLAFLKHVKQEDLTNGSVRFVEICNNDQNTEKRVLAVLEHGLIDTEGNVRNGLTCTEIFDITHDAFDKRYICQDILWVNENGQIESFRKKNNLPPDIAVYIKMTTNDLRTCGYSDAGITAVLPTDEERIAIIHHEAGHYAGRGERNLAVAARERIRQIARKIASGGNIQRQEYDKSADLLGDLRLMIADEVRAWEVGNSKVMGTMVGNIPLVGGATQNKLDHIAKKWLSEYEENFKNACNLFDTHFV